MLKLYYSPGACAISPHIALIEAGLEYELERVDLKAKKTEKGEDYWQIEPKGYIPALRLENGKLLTEGVAIVQYIADQVPTKSLAPKWGSSERYDLIGWLNFISTELHKGTAVLRNKDISDDVKKPYNDKLVSRYKLISDHFAKGNDWLMGKSFSVADGYLYNVTRWMAGLGVDLSGLPEISKFMERMSKRESVKRVIQEQGLPS